jgi:4-hydroxybenzoate polyprenyltransferase
VSKIFPPHSITISDWFRTLRVYQWLKNILLFVPLLASHQFDNIQSFSTLIFAFISFSLCASFVYITNDLFDLESDRYHPKKRDRPFASAKLPIMAGVILAPLLVFLSLILGWTIGIEFFVLLILYIVVTIIYSFLIKKIIILDCLTLSALFTLRIFAGAAATSIVVSFWLFVFSIFLFLSLAFVKRYAEIHTQKKIGKIHLHGRGYLVTDAPLIQILGIASGYTAMAVFALYLSSEKVTMLYSQPILLWLAKPLLIFWISWVWLKAHRGELDDDPIMFAIRDKTSLLVFGLITFIFLGGL